MFDRDVTKVSAARNLFQVFLVRLCLSNPGNDIYKPQLESAQDHCSWQETGSGGGPRPKPAAIPKDFLQKTAAHPRMQNKIKDWASKVELPASPEPPEITKVEIPKASRPTQKYNTRCRETITVEEAASGISGTTKIQSSRTEGIRIKPVRMASPRAGGDDKRQRILLALHLQ